MTAPATTQDAMQQTHQPRPTAKRMLPFRIVNYLCGGKPGYAVEYDTIVPMGQGKSFAVPKQIKVEAHQDGCHTEPLGRLIKELQDDYWALESRVDGLLASIDHMTTDNVLKDREIEKLTNQLAECKRSNEAAKGGKRKGES